MSREFSEERRQPLPLMTVGEVARYLHVNEKTVRRLVGRRALRCVRIGAVLRFDMADVLRFAAGRKE